MATTLFITAYGEKVKQPLYFSGPGRTKQAHKEECDINNILSRYKKTGVLAFQQQHEPQYADVSGINFQDAQFVVARARSLFAELPSHLRARFRNDPAQFLDFVQNEANRPEAEELGLVRPKDAKPEGPETGAAAPSPAPQASPTAASASPLPA